MAAIVLDTPANEAFVEGPEISYEYRWGFVSGAGSVNISRIRDIYNRKTYRWTAHGSQHSRELPAAEQATPGGNWYVANKGFTPASGSEFATLADGDTIYGTYFEVWEDNQGSEYWDATANEWVAT